MPTPPLPLLHQLLRILHVPVYPPTLHSISPSLLLIILETLIGYPLPLLDGVRACGTPEEEISVIKCILGVLTDDFNLGVGMTLVDPRRVVEGGEREMEVIIMAFAVLAKRRGLVLTIPRAEYEYEHEYDDWEDKGWEEGDNSLKLQDPIEPDISFSPTPRSNPRRPTTTTTNKERGGVEDVFTVPAGVPSSSDSESTKVGHSRTSETGSSPDAPLDHSRSSDSREVGTSRERTRTVLDEILEEFGI